ncbi:MULTISPECIES: hypothetical protein [unclassified Moorena]|uniref:hypothetical protein n=1 Tax=unclassified Moorena TaxID=2683338 RepID=UPI0013BD2CEF|nr:MULTISPECIES: hypothetical protein [unclassified Moorena]NEO35782.1 hypothetical protein [Moorena sp. SIOASIH]NEO68441.1 hypothetical protein [Moorena sp. SIO3H5]
MESIFAAYGGSTTQVNGILVARANKKRIWSIPTLVAQVYFSLRLYLIIVPDGEKPANYIRGKYVKIKLFLKKRNRLLHQ